MIPSDVASRLQSAADLALRPVATPQEVSDKLSGLVAGQRVIAEIAAQLPNGAYRAMINQRNITLALPFAAKNGDVLELLVTDADGKLALAVVSHASANAQQAPGTATTATLSRTAQFISQLLGEPRPQGEEARATPLNGNRPLAGAPPQSAQDILPTLKQALTQSGLFYESHQAQWVAGRLPTTALLQEPQGQLSPGLQTLLRPPGEENAAAQQNKALATGELPAPQIQRPTPTNAPVQTDTTPPALSADKAQVTATGGPIVHPGTQPLVQQQLDALATQNYAWQGQIWPGQEMRWEIDPEQTNRQPNGDEDATAWSTRLRLTLPQLGEVDARLRLDGDQLVLALSARDETTRERMRSESQALRQQFDAAGLTLASLGITAPSADVGEEGA